jgi:hypothetical protein
MADISHQLISFASAFPVVLVLIGGTAMTLTRMSHDPHGRAKVLGAVGILLGVRFVFPFVTPLVLNFGPIEEIGVRIILGGLMHSIPVSIAYALLFWALLGERRPRYPDQMSTR